MHSFHIARWSAPLALAVTGTAFAPGALANSASFSGVTDPQEIDRTVAAFTGAAVGEIGGARLPADRRLRLSPCHQPLAANWHGTAQTTVKVECPDPGGWHVFVALRTAPVPTNGGPQQQVVKRGDPITVMVRGRGFSVQQSGEAMEHGAIGDWIAIRTARRGEPIRARIERPGLAVIPSN